MSQSAAGAARSKRQHKRKSEKAAVDLNPSCPGCLPGHSVRERDDWIACESCSTWYHWLCVAANGLDQIETVDKFYCDCTTRTTTYKAAPRKSARETNKLDYSNFSQHLPAETDKFMKILATKDIAVAEFKRYQGVQITQEWAFGNPEAMLEPFVVETPEGLGMEMPQNDITISRISEIVGPQTPIEVIDVASQSSLAHWTLGNWAEYYENPKRDKVRNVISLEVSESPLANSIVAPEIVRKLDWVELYWPRDGDGKKAVDYPQVQKYCLMSPAKSVTSFHIDFAGSSVYYHILRGSKIFYFIRPTAANLRAYELWSGDAEKQENEWLGDDVDKVEKIELTAGNTMIIPTGWIHAVATPIDSLVIGGNFLSSLDIANQLAVYSIELTTKVPKKFRFPQFIRLNWLVAQSYATRLRSLPPTTPLPLDMSPRVLQGLLALSTFLIEQASRIAPGAPVSAERKRIAMENVPWDVVADPGLLARNLRKSVLQALGEELDDQCNTPPKHDTPPYDAGPVDTPRSSKRKAGQAELLVPPPNQFKNWRPPVAGSIKAAGPSKPSATPTPPANGGDPTLLERRTAPMEYSTKNEMRTDPSAPELGARMAEVVTKIVSTTAIRKTTEGARGEIPVLETRTVATTVEVVRWLPGLAFAPLDPLEDIRVEPLQFKGFA